MNSRYDRDVKDEHIGVHYVSNIFLIIDNSYTV